MTMIQPILPIRVCCLCLSLGPWSFALQHNRGTIDVQKRVAQQINPLNNRRQILETTAVSVASTFAVLGFPRTAWGGEVGARITKAVTQSDIGISVRRSVVRGAQIMDSVDGKWEQLSDRFGLGAARQQQPGRPAPKVIPDPKPLDESLAAGILNLSDEVFRQVTQTSDAELGKLTRRIQETVKPSFLRSGLTMDDLEGKSIQAQTFNFLCYCHFRAYSDILIKQRIDFRSFLNKFEDLFGRKLVLLLLDTTAQQRPISNYDAVVNQEKGLLRQLDQARGVVDVVAREMVEKGLVAEMETSPSWEEDQVDDWLEDLSNLQWSIALDGDITLGAQILLQEQGYRLYPNIAKFAVKSILTASMPNQTVDISDYYLDTDYNSDPKKFEVKEILLNVVLEEKN